MTDGAPSSAITKVYGRPASRLALPGLVVPGLGHLIPWLGTAWFSLRLALARRRAARHPSQARRQALQQAQDARRVWFNAHGDHGDFSIGANLIAHVALLVWTLLAGLPRASAVIFAGPAGSIDTHAVIGLLYAIAMVGLLWFMAWRRAFPPALDEAHFNSNRQVFLRTFKKNTNGMLGVLGVLTIVSIAVVTPWIAPFDPTDTSIIGGSDAPPGWVTNTTTQERHYALFGTDTLGRDQFSRMLYGGRISLSIGFVAILIAGSIGTSLGAVAGFFGGWIDRAITWFIDLLISVPRLILLLAILGIFRGQDLAGAGKIYLIVVVLGLTGWMGVSRIVRGQVLSLSRQDFIQAARALGLSPLRIMYRHLVPNALAPVIVYASLAIGSTILVEASLSFLGLGISQPTPTWGSLVSEGRSNLSTSWWLSTFPGLLIVWAVLSFNLLGDGLRDALDPKFRGE